MSLNNAIYKGADFNTFKVEESWIEYPFRDQGDIMTKIYHHVGRIHEITYTPLANDVTMTAATDKPNGSPFQDDANAFYVGDYDLSQAGDGLVRFDRQFANIPSDRTLNNGLAEPNGLYGFTFPDTSSITEDVNGTGSYTFSYDTQTGYIDASFNVSSSDFLKLALNDNVILINKTDFFKIENTNPSSIFIGDSLFPARIIALSSNNVTVRSYWVSGGTNITITNNRDGGFTGYTLKRYILQGRNDVAQINASSFIESRYIKTTGASSIASDLENRFVVLNEFGTETTNLGSTTIPTNEQYGNMYSNGEYINAEPETINRWRGNIFEKKLIKVKTS